jgi:hypothetical protein
MRKKTLYRERGQSIVIIAILMVGMIAMLGLILDGGNAFYQRRRMQNASDASALAGGRQLALAKGVDNNSYAAVIAIQNAINDYINSNGGDVSALKTDFVDQYGNPIPGSGIGSFTIIPAAATGVSVTISTPFPTYFLRVLNVDNGTAGAHTTVQTGAPSAQAQLFPTAIATGTLVAGSPVDGVHCQFNDVTGNNPPCVLWADTFAAGSNGWTDLLTINGDPYTGNCPNPPGGGSTYLINLLNPNNEGPLVSPNTWICTSSGTGSGVGKALYGYSYYPWDSYIGRHVTIPIFDAINGRTGSNLAYHVVNFAEFVVTAFYYSSSIALGDTTGCLNLAAPGTTKVICGKIVNWADPGGYADPGKKCKYGFCTFTMSQ